jgi:hypothetical protein
MYQYRESPRRHFKGYGGEFIRIFAGTKTKGPDDLSRPGHAVVFRKDGNGKTLGGLDTLIRKVVLVDADRNEGRFGLNLDHRIYRAARGPVSVPGPNNEQSITQIPQYHGIHRDLSFIA